MKSVPPPEPIELSSFDSIIKCSFCNQMICKFGWKRLTVCNSNICTGCLESVTIIQVNKYLVDKFKHGNRLLTETIKQIIN